MMTSRLEVLVVEDDDAIREVLRDLLEDAGFEVRDVRDGAHALAILRASERSLVILLDNLLPDLNGDEMVAALDGDEATRAASAVSGDHARIAIERHGWVVITASPRSITPAFARRLAELGAPVIAKPFDMATLMAAVNQVALRLAL